MDVKKGIDSYSFLLRLWQVKEYGGKGWRASLENVESGEKRGFTCLAELLIFLSQAASQENNAAGEGRQTEVQG